MYGRCILIGLNVQGLLELQKAQRMARLDGAWEKDMKKLQKVATFTLAYCQGKVMAFLVSKAMSSHTKKTMTFSNLVQTVPNY